MIRIFSQLAFVLAAFAGLSAPVWACPTAGHPIKLINLTSDGIVTRSVYVRKDIDGQNGKRANPKFIRVVRDRIQLEHDDVVVLDAAPTMVDAKLLVQIKLKEQDRDEKGILSSTYHVVELASGSFGGPTKTIKTAYLATVKGNYLGNGTYSRGCGEVIKIDLDLESSSDTR